jgi:tetratricopeptide (TPR) repeat protein
VVLTPGIAPQLPGPIHAQIAELCKQGDNLAATGQLESARQHYLAALRLLPAQYRDWQAATWIYAALGDVHFRLENHGKALKSFQNAVQCPGGLGNPYIHLRLGQLYFERDQLDNAADELARAYMGGGIDIFMEDDPRYLAFLETRIAL